MDKDFMQYVYARIEKALIENAEYMQLQSDCATAHGNKDYSSCTDIADEMDAKATELCYIQGYKDGLKMALELQN